MKKNANKLRSSATVILMMFCWTVSLGQAKIYVDRDSLYNVLVNVAELKLENQYLTKKVSDQKLIIHHQGIVIRETELQVSILDTVVRKEPKRRFWNGFWKGTALGALLVLVGVMTL